MLLTCIKKIVFVKFWDDNLNVGVINLIIDNVQINNTCFNFLTTTYTIVIITLK